MDSYLMCTNLKIMFLDMHGISDAPLTAEIVEYHIIASIYGRLLEL